MTTNLSLATELERIASVLESDPGATSQVSLTNIAERIAKNLGVKTDEIAIMGVSSRWRHLHFLVPESLKQVGFIPLSSTSAVAARTARESRPDIINEFASVRHATVFEGVKVGGESSELIQKMISAPILCGDKVVGVIQISRKGPNAKNAGPDFTADDLGKVLALCKPLGKLLQHITRDS
ncbi:MAG: GAF domain-containing protein [Candidatus Acidiferrum sp.]